MEIARRQLGENTRAVHLPPPPETAQRPLGTPVYRTAAWAFSSAEEYAAVLNDQVPGYSYSRIDNPTVDAFARAVAALEGANLSRWPAAQGFASGMAAISGVFLAFARAGAHVVASAAVYGGTYSLLRNVLTRFGVETDFVDITDLDAVRAAVRPATRIIYAETIANPTTAVADLRQLAEIAHERGALLVIDTTLAPPVICRPLEHGADLVVHSATKYIGGHSDVTGGVVTGSLELIGQIRATRIDTGGSLSPDDAFQLRRGHRPGSGPLLDRPRRRGGPHQRRLRRPGKPLPAGLAPRNRTAFRIMDLTLRQSFSRWSTANIFGLTDVSLPVLRRLRLAGREHQQTEFA